VEVCTPVSETGPCGRRSSWSVTNSGSQFKFNKNKHLTREAATVRRHFMTDILSKSIVLVLNRNWQAINIRTPQEAFCQMATNVATGLEIEGKNHIRPVTWEEWIRLPIRPRTTPCIPCVVQSACRL